MQRDRARVGFSSLRTHLTLAEGGMTTPRSQDNTSLGKIPDEGWRAVKAAGAFLRRLFKKT